ncbi:MAG: type I restriction endonuclease [Deltaproteobacteria bacterium]
MEQLLQQFINDLKNKKIFSISEDATKISIVLKLLNILGWNVFDNEEVYPEYAVGGKRVDYCLRQGQRNLVFIEVKKTEEDLESHQEQLLNYAFHEGIEIAILTNGVAWWFYLPLNPGSWEQRKFFSIDFLKQQDSEIINNLINFLSKENVTLEKAIDTAKKMYKSNRKDEAIYSALPKAWNSLIAETNELLIELLNDTNEKICGYRATDEQIAEFLDSNKNQLLLGSFKFQNDKKTTERKVSFQKTSEYVPAGYTGKSPTSFMINNKKIIVKYWIDMLTEVCNFLYNNRQSNFEQKVCSLKGRKRVYFSRNRDELREPMQIKNSGIYVESNLSANNIVRLSENLLVFFGYAGDLQIEAK